MRGMHLSRRLLIASCALIYFFLMLPLMVVFPISLSSAPYMQFPPPGLSWQWYVRYLDDPQWIDSTWRSHVPGGSGSESPKPARSGAIACQPAWSSAASASRHMYDDSG